MSYIWENNSWPNLSYEGPSVSKALEDLLKEKQMTDIAYSIVDNQTRRQLVARYLTEDIVSSLSIEGESIDVDSVYSSVSKHLDITFTGKSKDSAYARSVFSVVTDALENHGPLTDERLCEWNRKLFENKAGIRPKTAGLYRTGPEYVMRISGRNREIVYEGVRPESLHQNMDTLLTFINANDGIDPFIKAAVASLWFVIIHPFEDGNGRISRAIADYIISKSSDEPLHAFSISSGILKNRGSYYEQIQVASVGNDDMDISNWVAWFLDTVTECIIESRETLRRTLKTASFIKSLDPSEFNSREMSMLYKLADGSFFGKLTTDKWVKMNKCSNAVAFRDIQHLVQLGYLIPSEEHGRNAGYYFNQASVQES